MNNRELAVSLTTNKIKELRAKRGSNKYIDELVKYAYSKFKVRQDITLDIISERIAIETLTDELLYKFLASWIEAGTRVGMTHLCNVFELNKLFTEIENRDYAKPYKLKDVKSDIKIPHGSWHMTDIYPHKYITIHTDANEVINWRNNNSIRYNPETQRDLIKINNESGDTYKLDINVEAVDKIKRLMLSNEYFTVQGTLNLNPEHNEVTVKIDDGDLIIPYEAKLDLIEGFHNYKALCNAKDESPDWNFPCEYRLYFLNTDQAGNYIAQMDKKNHFSKNQINRIDATEPINVIINALNTDSRSILKGTINEEMRDFIASVLKKYDLSDVRKRFVFIEDFKSIASKYVLSKLGNRVNLYKYEWLALIYITFLKENPIYGNEIEYMDKILKYCEDNFYNIKDVVSSSVFNKLDMYMKGVLDNV